MRRRAFLATAGTLLTAGCGALTGGNGGGGNSGGPGLHSDDIGVDSDLEVPEIDNPEIDSEIDGAGDINISEFDVDIDNSEIGEINVDAGLTDENATATPENKKATKFIANGRVKLQSAYHKYTSQGTGKREDIFSVKPTQDSFRSISIKSDVEAAFTELEKAAPHATKGQAANIKALEHTGYFLHMSAKIDRLLVAAYKHFEFTKERYFNESMTQGGLARTRMKEDFDEATKIYDELEDKVLPKSMKAFSLLTENQFERKLRQFDNRIAAFQSFDEGIQTIANGLVDVKEGVEAYQDERWEDANGSFIRATAQFGSAATSFTLVPAGSGMTDQATQLTRDVRTMEQATEDLRRSAQAKVDGERLIHLEAERAAESHIKSNETIKNIDSFGEIVY